ncbi:MAG TPA: SH3 domain-containing protein [Anaerolineales bacterium]|nr:SH3 domain-containing protein [Anaerolineales bacterium]
MKNNLWLIFPVFILVATSCNLPGGQLSASPSPTPDFPLSSSATPTLVPIETLLAQSTPTSPAPPPTFTPGIVLIAPKDQPVNCRYGPGLSYAIVGALLLGRQAEAIGRNEDSTWWYVRNPSDPSTVCWLSAEFTTVSGNAEALPVVGPPEIGVTNIRVTVEPPVMNVACNAFPQYVLMSAQISTNGPTIVTWKWTTSIGDSSEEKTLLFEEAGVKTVQEYYSVPSANDYWIDVHSLLPNMISGRGIFKITCTP